MGTHGWEIDDFGVLVAFTFLGFANLYVDVNLSQVLRFVFLIWILGASLHVNVAFIDTESTRLLLCLAPLSPHLHSPLQLLRTCHCLNHLIFRARNACESYHFVPLSAY